MTWESTRLGEFITLKRGYDLPSSLRVDGPVLVVSSSGVTGCHDVAKVRGPGVVTGRYGTLGEVFFIDEDFWPLNTALYVQDFQGNDPRFSAYFLESVLTNTDSNKAAVPGVNRNDLHALTVRATRDLGEQLAIASVLGAYDDLIENNRRRIRLLERRARLIYEEWFVRLRFPGHEHVRIVDGVPEGWKVATAHSVMDVLGGGTPRTTVRDYWGGEIPFYTPKDASETAYVLRTERAITAAGLKNCNSRLYERNTLFISARGTVGKLHLALRPMAMSQSCYALVGQGHVSQFFLYCALKEAIEHFRQHAVGAVFDAIVVDTFKLIPFVVPDEKRVRFFDEATAPLFRQVANLMEQCEKLHAARELLLPRLMNGELEP